MILLLTRKEYDQGTDPVVEWLQYYKADFLKVFVEDLISNKSKQYIDVINGNIWTNNKNLTEAVNVIWYRRFGESITLELPGEQIFKQLNYECSNEVAYLTNYLFFSLKDKTWMPHYSMVDVNKLEILQQARTAGLKVPDTAIINNRDGLDRFYHSHKKSIVTKPIHFSGYYIKDEYTHSAYTSEIPADFISYLPDFFFPTQVQEKIQSIYEVRTFFIEDEFYSTAILNGKKDGCADIKLSFDENSIAWVPYHFPDAYKAKLSNFFQRINLNTGSFDCIKNYDEEYVFLEVNPVGQYNAPSQRCNYNIEKIIAEWLIKKDKNEKSTTTNFYRRTTSADTALL